MRIEGSRSHAGLGNAPFPGPDPSYWVACHAISMSVLFAIVLPAGIFIGRYKEHVSEKYWLKLHISIMLSGVLLFILGMVSLNLGVPHSAQVSSSTVLIHRGLGYGVNIAFAFQLLLGLLFKKWYEPNSSANPFGSRLHRFFGKAILGIGCFNIVLGIRASLRLNMTTFISARQQEWSFVTWIALLGLLAIRFERIFESNTSYDGLSLNEFRAKSKDLLTDLAPIERQKNLEILANKQQEQLVKQVSPTIHNSVQHSVNHGHTKKSSPLALNNNHHQSAVTPKQEMTESEGHHSIQILVATDNMFSSTSLSPNASSLKRSKSKKEMFKKSLGMFPSSKSTSSVSGREDE